MSAPTIGRLFGEPTLSVLRVRLGSDSRGVARRGILLEGVLYSRSITVQRWRKVLQVEHSVWVARSLAV